MFAGATIVFDLDGTLIESKWDIADSVNLTLRDLGKPERSQEEIFGFVGDGVKRLLRLSVGDDRLDRYQEARDAFALVLRHQPAHAGALGLKGDLAKQAGKLMPQLYNAFIGTDASQIEINPLAVTDDGKLLVLDAKVGFDSNAEFRHPELEALRDLSEEDPMEIEASKYDLAYIKLDGDIGCMVNGAGLAMATMDIIKLAGGEPANFLDVGGGASQERVEAAFRILLADPAVRAVLINIFGGIVRTDMVARGARILMGGNDVAYLMSAARQAATAMSHNEPDADGYFVTYGGQFENLQRAEKRLATVVPVVFLLIGSLLFMALRSGKEAVLVFSCVPLALVGGILALLLRGMPFSVSAAVGFIAVSGVATLTRMMLEHVVEALEDA